MRSFTVLLALGATAIPTAAAQVCGVVQANLAHDGSQPVSNSYVAGISASGSHVAWTSESANVLPGLTNNSSDVFVTDLETGAIELASTAFTGGDADDDSKWGVSLSSDGRLVAFHSNATNLLSTPHSVPGIYLRDLNAGVTERIDVTPAGGEPGGAATYAFTMSASGRYIVFTSHAPDLVAGFGNPGGWWQVYLRDRWTGVTEPISLNTQGKLGKGHSTQSAVTPCGRFVLFSSSVDNLVAGDGNGESDVFLRDRQTGSTERVSVGTGGIEASGGGGGLSADGRFVTFQSSSGNLAPGAPAGVSQVYVRDRVLDVTSLVSSGPSGPGNMDSYTGALSPCGGYALFDTVSTNLWPGVVGMNSKVYERDLAAGTTRLVSLNANGTAPVAYTAHASYTADARTIAYVSKSSQLTSVPDPNGRADVFVSSCPPPGPVAYCVAEVNSLGCAPLVGSNGSPSASAGSGFDVTSSNTLSQRTGLFFYSLVGPRLTPFQGGLRCVESPTRRTPLRSSGGNATLDCSGVFALDFNAWITSGADPALVAAQAVWGQWWSRDAGSSFSTNLSDAVTFVIGP